MALGSPGNRFVVSADKDLADCHSDCRQVGCAAAVLHYENFSPGRRKADHRSRRTGCGLNYKIDAAVLNTAGVGKRLGVSGNSADIIGAPDVAVFYRQVLNRPVDNAPEKAGKTRGCDAVHPADTVTGTVKPARKFIEVISYRRP